MAARPPVASIVIPTYNHATWLREAIASALAQTVPCEVIVIDDGSTDHTPELLDNTDPTVIWDRIQHAGPSVARNRGLELASADFVMLLDADDLIAPTKVERQIEAFDDQVGWVLCDVRIEDDAKGLVTTASKRYGYAAKNLGGWIQPLLVPGNFIPIMSPLVRRSIIQQVRFRDDRVPEDWHFWHELAGLARVRYLPDVLATYRKRRTGRSRIPARARAVEPNIVQPLRLNLGCGTPDTRSWHPIAGMVNLDKSLGWCFEDGLTDFTNHSVAGITISHALMYVPLERWPYVFSEFARVLADGGVIRITEDDAINPASSRVGGWRGSQPAVTLTSAAIVIEALERAGLEAREVDATTTAFSDRSLCQAQHGAPPDVFFVEGRRMPGVLFAPHNDDEALFAAFTILRHRPRVVVCYQSERDYGDPAVREAESRSALSILGAAGFEQWHGGDLVAEMRALDLQHQPARVWAPDVQASHPDHVAVARAAIEVFGGRITTFHTYDAGGKVRSQLAVPHEPAWIHAKLRALARYETQATHPRASAFFAADLLEYYGGRW